MAKGFPKFVLHLFIGIPYIFSISGKSCNGQKYEIWYQYGSKLFPVENQKRSEETQDLVTSLPWTIPVKCFVCVFLVVIVELRPAPAMFYWSRASHRDDPTSRSSIITQTPDRITEILIKVSRLGIRNTISEFRVYFVSTDTHSGNVSSDNYQKMTPP